jgi:hypothetical protein
MRACTGKGCVCVRLRQARLLRADVRGLGRLEVKAFDERRERVGFATNIFESADQCDDRFALG